MDTIPPETGVKRELFTADQEDGISSMAAIVSSAFPSSRFSEPDFGLPRLLIGLRFGGPRPCRIREYTDFRSFIPLIGKARETCLNSGHAVFDHIVEANEMVALAT